MTTHAALIEPDDSGHRSVLHGFRRTTPARPSRLIVILALAAGCSGLPGRNAPVLEASAAIDGDRLVVQGSTDLPDGAQVNIQTCHESEAAHKTDREPRYCTYDDVTVRGGSFRETIPIGDWPPGRIDVWTSLQPHALQPPGVVERWGETGERLSGPGVEDADEGRRVMLRTSVQHDP